MDLNELIKIALVELEKSKQHEGKSKYIVDEVTMEVNITESNSTGGGLKVVFADANINQSSIHSNKIIVKLKPRNALNKITINA